MDKLSNDRGGKGSRHEDAYVRFVALVAAIVRMVWRLDTERTKISSVLTPARKKVWQVFPAFWDRIRAELEFARHRIRRT